MALTYAAWASAVPKKYSISLAASSLPGLAAIIQAGQLRIRPIFMTSATTILALFPLTLGIGEGAALRAPLAVAVIGGLVTSTLLTLVVIPAVYRILGGRLKLREEKV